MAKKQTRPTRKTAAAPPILTAGDRTAVAFGIYKLLEDLSPADWPGPDDLRDIAARLGVPYLLLLLDYYTEVEPPRITLEDIAAWNASPAAQRVLASAWAARAAAATKAVA